MNLEPFARVIRQAEGSFALAHACLLIAQDAYPSLDVPAYLAEIERLAVRLRSNLRPAADEEARILALNAFLFEDLGYTGNTEDYYDPRNSYLNDVIDRRTGIPITLAILYMELGRRVGLPLQGVSFPGHFLVRMPLRGGLLVLDPFLGGMPQSEDELRERLERVIPAEAGGNIPLAELPLDVFLEAATPRQIVARLLRNLKSIHRDADAPEQLLAVLNRMLIVSPDASAELRDRGYVYQRLECWRPALEDLSAYAEREPDAPDLDEVRGRISELRLLCARLN